MDRFRDLEKTGESGRKDAALLAAIAGYESLRRPSRLDQHRFARLFVALFEFAGAEARRTAAAALCRLDGLPSEVSHILATSPIEISAPFLAFSPDLGDELLIDLIEKGDPATAGIIRGRRKLSRQVAEAAAGVNTASEYAGSSPGQTVTDNDTTPLSEPAPTGGGGSERENELREALRALVRYDRSRQALAVPALGKDAELDEALLDAAVQGDRDRFHSSLAERLASTPALADRIMMDHSGRQLAMVLQTLEFSDAAIIRTLQCLFPHLGTMRQGRSPAALVLQDCDPEASRRKVEAWRKANRPKWSGSGRYRPVVESAERRQTPERSVRRDKESERFQDTDFLNLA